MTLILLMRGLLCGLPIFRTLQSRDGGFPTGRYAPLVRMTNSLSVRQARPLRVCLLQGLELISIWVSVSLDNFS